MLFIFLKIIKVIFCLIIVTEKNALLILIRKTIIAAKVRLVKEDNEQ